MNLDISKGFVSPMAHLPFEAQVELAAQDVNGEAVSFDPVQIEGTYVVADDTVTVEGHLRTVAHAACALCLGPAEAPVELDFQETFRKDANEEQDEFFRYEGKNLPLDHMTLTLVMLNLPMRFVCSQSCSAGAEYLGDVEDAPQPEPEEEGTYRPFEGLKDLLENRQ